MCVDVVLSYFIFLFFSSFRFSAVCLILVGIFMNNISVFTFYFNVTISHSVFRPFCVRESISSVNGSAKPVLRIKAKLYQ